MAYIPSVVETIIKDHCWSLAKDEDVLCGVKNASVLKQCIVSTYEKFGQFLHVAKISLMPEELQTQARKTTRTVCRETRYFGWIYYSGFGECSHG
jgi:hypothetical protein